MNYPAMEGTSQVMLIPPTSENISLMVRQTRAALEDAAARFAYYTLSPGLEPEVEAVVKFFCGPSVSTRLEKVAVEAWPVDIVAAGWAEEAKMDWLDAARRLAALLGDDLQGHDLGSSGD